ncbi:nitroreductase family protein [Halobacillus aidingensis]|uniref:Nitroreductase n=1 Tax=Halobacillus aidingensis TaxID=240303 RepID=A0A1H0HRD3_HALAD|nr:nitroreductase [Halobacillus aidingensis]SDO21726.1 Nitroreductase [Halobacillus aidingensis]
MELMEAIRTRRSIHEYKEEKVDHEVLSRIFGEAAWAPNHRMKEPWHIRLYQDKGKEAYAQAVMKSYQRQGFFDGYDLNKTQRLQDGIQDFLLNIPHHALIYMERDEDIRKYEEDYAAVCAYIQNVQLLAWEAGVGVLWTTSPYLHDNQFYQDIGLDSQRFKLVSVLQMGYPKRIPKPKIRTPIQKKLSLYDGKEKS